MDLLDGERLKGRSVNQTYGLPSWFLRVFQILVILVAGLIVLGGSVRVMNAGLACPDWPLCYGNVIPDFHPQVYFEFIHRVVAGTVSLVTLILQIILFRQKRVPTRLKVFGATSLALLASQVVLGGLTVLLQLKSGIVAAHLGIGTAFFGTLLWMYLDLRSQRTTEQVTPALSAWTKLVAVAVYGQILLGGLVASNYAALACLDFPTCHGEWFPQLVGPVGLHMIHRFGACTVTLIVILNAILMSGAPAELRKRSRWMVATILVQVALGISNVMFYTPPLLAILHLAVGINLFYLSLRQEHFATLAETPETAPALKLC